MSDCDCDHDEEEEQSDEAEQTTRQAEMMAGQLFVSAEGETTEEAVEGVKDLWDKAVEDVGDMDQDDRNHIGLQ